MSHDSQTGSLRRVAMTGEWRAQVIKGYQKFSATPKYMVYN